MAISLHNLKKSSGLRKKVRLGRGDASGKGSYSGRGMKGQRSRSGGKGGLKLKGFKQNLLNFPKFKGIKSVKPNNQVITLNDLNSFNDGDKVNPQSLLEKSIISKIEVPVKILNTGELKSKVEVEKCLVSTSAKSAIEKAGGKVLQETSEKKASDKKEEKSSK